MVTRWTSVVASVLFVVSQAKAQLYTVDAHDPSADFQRLDTALATVPEGTTLLLLSDIDEGANVYYVDFDVKIVGHPDKGARIAGPFEIRDANVVMSWLTIQPVCDYDGINAAFSQLHLDQCEIFAGCEHDGVEVSGKSLLMMDACYAWSEGFDGVYYNKSLFVDADAVAVLKDCKIESLDPKYAGYIAGELFHADTTFLGDLATVGNGAETQLDGTLDVAHGSFRIGDMATLHGHAATMALLLYNFTGLQDPLPLFAGAPLLIHSPFFIIPVISDPTQTWTLSGLIPDDPVFIGVGAYFQQFDVSLHQLSCVDAAVIGS